MEIVDFSKMYDVFLKKIQDVPHHLRMLSPTRHDEKTWFGGGFIVKKKTLNKHVLESSKNRF